jgi:hypothetical protein
MFLSVSRIKYSSYLTKGNPIDMFLIFTLKVTRFSFEIKWKLRKNKGSWEPVMNDSIFKTI